MLEYGYAGYRMHIGEMLGNVTERVRTMELPEVLRSDFAFPNCLMLERTGLRSRLSVFLKIDFVYWTGVLK